MKRHKLVKESFVSFEGTLITNLKTSIKPMYTKPIAQLPYPVLSLKTVSIMCIVIKFEYGNSLFQLYIRNIIEILGEASMK